jgi:hypothetical protein
VAMLNKDWTNAKEILMKLPPNWIIAKKYLEFMSKQVTPKEDWDGSFDIRKYIL